ncbi:MAG: PTS sugar transporter subunit IIA [Actinomycetaceae bacterium]|nr:PTS sugar transporter subunit IIA [Actinomycetaceae bacterium]
MTTLRDLLTPESIHLNITVADWKEAVTVAGSALVDCGACGPTYTQAMLDSIEEHGPYVVIAPGFALPHARADNSVSRTALSFIRLSEPVSFGHKKNDPVTLVMGLVAVDTDAHQAALAELAGLLADPARKQQLMDAASTEEVFAALEKPASPARSKTPQAPPPTPTPRVATAQTQRPIPEDAVPSKGLILTVCGNGLGTSLFLKNTLEKVLDAWGWARLLNVEATDTISAKGRAKEADVVMTSEAIALTLGDVGVPMEIINDFTSLSELDAALRRVYAI